MKFWTQLPKPIFILAPMEDVTDVVFRDLVASVAAPDVFFTEFVHASNVVDQTQINQKKDLFAYSRRLQKSKANTIPLVAQIWGNKREEFIQAARIIFQLQFSGIDINLGCPSKKMRKKNCCSGLIGKHKEITNLISALRDGLKSTTIDTNSSLARVSMPISIKTRLAYSDETLASTMNTWFDFLLDLDIDALIMHARTVKNDESPANWKAIEMLANIKAKKNAKTLLIGNGDITSYDQMQNYSTQYGIDGVMVGRGIFKQLDIFSKLSIKKTSLDKMQGFPFKRRLKIMKNHIKMHYDTWKNDADYNVLKRFYKVYLDDTKPKESQLRDLLNHTFCHKDAFKILKKA